jgi:deazaflavin-dependent oxidoreductase (nitroreductase family)
MRKLLVLLAVIGAVAALVAAWVRNKRVGSGVANDIVNPFLVRRGLAGTGRAEIGTLEHVGRTSGVRRLTPIHPVPTDTGFRIVVPLGEQSQWVRNVLAAGHCRIQLHDVVYELDEPVLLAASEVPEVPAPLAWVLDRLGVEYLLLRRFAEAPGRLEPVAEDAATGPAPDIETPAPEAVGHPA